IGNVDVELLLELHDQLHDVEAVRTEVLDEARVIGKLLTLDAELLLDDVADFLRVVVGHGRASSPLRFDVGYGNLLCHEGGCHMTIPPSTTKTCPVMYAARSDARNATTPATSFGVPSRSSGICCESVVRASGVIAAVMSVSMKPGATTLARMFLDASSFATDFVRPMRPALLAA